MALSEGSHAPRWRDITLGVTLAVIALVVLLRLADVVKLTGAALYWLPARLGLLRQADASQVWRFDLSTMGEALSFSTPGRYMIYTADYDLLVVSDTLREKELSPWLEVSDPNTGVQAPARFVMRGMRVYDSHLAPGRPVFSVEIARPGPYVVKAPRRPVEIAIVRDYVTGNEVRIGAVFTVELLLLAAPFAWLFGRPYLRRRQSQKAVQRARRAEADAVFQRLQDRRLQEKRQALHSENPHPRRAQADDDPHAPYKPKD